MLLWGGDGKPVEAAAAAGKMKRISVHAELPVGDTPVAGFLETENLWDGMAKGKLRALILMV